MEIEEGRDEGVEERGEKVEEGQGGETDGEGLPSGQREELLPLQLAFIELLNIK